LEPLTSIAFNRLRAVGTNGGGIAITRNSALTSFTVNKLVTAGYDLTVTVISNSGTLTAAETGCYDYLPSANAS